MICYGGLMKLAIAGHPSSENLPLRKRLEGRFDDLPLTEERQPDGSHLSFLHLQHRQRNWRS